MTLFDIGLVVFGGLLVVMAVSVGWIRRTLRISEPVIALGLGLALGPAGLGLMDLSRWGSSHHVLEQAARLTVAIVLMEAALRLPRGYFRRHWKTQAVLLGPVMAAMWLVSGVAVWLVVGLGFWLALTLGAVITPTDPVVAQAIVTGSTAEQNLPARLRHALSAESAANDCLAYPFMLLPLLMMSHRPPEALGQWLIHTLLWGVIAAALVGATVGWLGGKVLMYSWKANDTDKPSVMTSATALTLLVLGGVKLMGSDGILAVLLAGVFFKKALNGELEYTEENIQEAVSRFFILPVFVVIGLAAPVDRWLELGWVGPTLVAAVLLLRRLPAILASFRATDQVTSVADALFLGWFGPIGVAAAFYAMVAVRETGQEIIWTAASLVIVASVFVHGLTSTTLTLWYGARRRAS